MTLAKIERRYGPDVDARHAKARRDGTPLFRVEYSSVCHIQRKPDGQYGFNCEGWEKPHWVGPEFDSLEACVLWLQLMGEL